MGVIDFIIDRIIEEYSYFSKNLPPKIFLASELFFLAIFIAIISYFVWKFYKTLSKRNFITLDLSKYNWSKHPVARKLLAVLFYFIEYILIMPILIMLWFVALSTILLLMASQRNVSELLLISGALVMAIRILAYYKEEISIELAKLFPFIALSVFLLTPETFNTFNFFNKLKELPNLFDNVIYFLVIILILEIILRAFYTLNILAKGEEIVGREE